MNPLGWRLGLGEKTKDIKIAEILTSFNKKQIKVVNYDSRGN